MVALYPVTHPNFPLVSCKITSSWHNQHFGGRGLDSWSNQEVSSYQHWFHDPTNPKSTCCSKSPFFSSTPTSLILNQREIMHFSFQIWLLFNIDAQRWEKKWKLGASQPRSKPHVAKKTFSSLLRFILACVLLSDLSLDRPCSHHNGDENVNP